MPTRPSTSFNTRALDALDTVQERHAESAEASAVGGATPSAPEDSEETHSKKLIFFERLYFLLDADGDGAVPRGTRRLPSLLPS